jgi:Fe-S-cluster containining protein
MEIHIDFAAVRSIVAAEYTLAAGQIEQWGPVQACEYSQARHDQRLAGASDASTLACKAGCHWCCYFTVDVRPVEVLCIVQFMEQALPAAERQRIAHQIEANLQLLTGADEDARVRLNIQCPFLNQGRCVIYSARPQTCRNYHATNAAGCQQSFEHPEDEDIDPEFAPMTYQIGAAHVDGFAKAMAAAGYDHTVFELNAALAHAMADPTQARQRLEARQTPFSTLSGASIPLEFEDE